MARIAVESLNDSELQGRNIHVREDKISVEVWCPYLFISNSLQGFGFSNVEKIKHDPSKANSSRGESC